MSRVGTALIGCGKVGATHAKALAVVPESHFVGAFDVDGNRARGLAESYGVRTYDDVEEMLHDPEVEMVSVCTPHPTHATYAVAACRAGVHVLLEKPMAPDLTGCDAAIAAAEKGGVRLGVISQRRFYEPVQRVKRAILEGRIGKPILATLNVLGWRDEAYYRSDPWRGKWETEGGGVLVNQASHHLDLLQWLVGSVAELFGYWDNFNHPYVEVEDTAVAVVRFECGALATILTSNSQKPGLYGKIHVHGDSGSSVGVQVDGGSPFIAGVSETVEPPFNDIWTIPGEEHLLGQWQDEDRARAGSIDVMSHYHKLQIQDFLNAIVEDREPEVDGHEGRKAVEIMTAIYRSQRDRTPVSFPVDAEMGSELYDGRLSRRRDERAAFGDQGLAES